MNTCNPEGLSPHLNFARMFSQDFTLLVILLLLAASGYTNDKPYEPELDNIPPSAIIDLTIDTSTSNSITLTWTSPGDNGDIGTASEYDIRYSTSEIDENTWNNATKCEDEPSPQPPGSRESFIVTGLEEGIEYYFAIRTADKIPNWSTISNIIGNIIKPSSYITWQRIYDTEWKDIPNEVIVTDDNCYLIAGQTDTYGLGYGDGYLVKFDQAGDILWQKTYGTRRHDQFRSICKTSYGYAMAGESGWTDAFYPGVIGAFFVGIDREGNELWRHTWYGVNNAIGWQIIPANDGGTIVVGATNTGLAMGQSFDFYRFLLKIDDNGVITDSMILTDSLKEGLSTFYARSITSVSDGYIIAGFSNYGQAFVKVSTDLQDFEINYIDTDNVTIWNIESCPDGNVIAVGEWPFNSETPDLIMIKLDESGNDIWTRTYSYDEPQIRDEGICVTPAPDGGFVAAGITQDSDFVDIYMIKVDAYGNEQWKRRYGKLHSAELGLSIAATPDGGYIIAGDSWEDGWADLYMIKTDPRGLVHTE